MMVFCHTMRLSKPATTWFSSCTVMNSTSRPEDAQGVEELDALADRHIGVDRDRGAGGEGMDLVGIGRAIPAL